MLPEHLTTRSTSGPAQAPTLFGEPSEKGYFPYFAKYAPDGQILWFEEGDQAIFVSAIAVDGTGNLYVTGSYGRAADFNPGPATAVLMGDSAMYLLKLDTHGQFVSVMGIGGLDNELDAEAKFLDVPRDIAIDSTGHVLITGKFYASRSTSIRAPASSRSLRPRHSAIPSLHATTPLVVLTGCAQFLARPTRPPSPTRTGPLLLRSCRVGMSS